MVEARLQVFRTFFSFFSFSSSTRFSSSGAQNGPFLMLLDMFYYLLTYFALRCLTMNFSVRLFLERVL